MRRSFVAVSFLLSVACAEDVGDGPNFGSGSGMPTGAPATSSGGSSGAGAAATTAGGGTGDATDETGATATSPETSETHEGGSTLDDGSTTGDGVAGTESTSESTGTNSDPTGDGTPLDPNLDVPDEGESCSFPGSLNECPGVATVCRFYTVEEGRCESCDNCGNLNAPCSEGTDCDILFSCFAGRCTNFCELGTFGCGPIEDCLDVGHPTHGVCDPFA